MQFSTLSRPDGEAKEGGGFSVAFRLEGREGSRVSLYGLRALALHRVQLHGAHYAVLLR